MAHIPEMKWLYIFHWSLWDISVHLYIQNNSVLLCYGNSCHPRICDPYTPKLAGSFPKSEQKKTLLLTHCLLALARCYLWKATNLHKDKGSSRSQFHVWDESDSVGWTYGTTPSANFSRRDTTPSVVMLGHIRSSVRRVARAKATNNEEYACPLPLLP